MIGATTVQSTATFILQLRFRRGIRLYAGVNRRKGTHVMNNLDKMSFAELTEIQREIDRAMAAKRNNERAEVRAKLIAIAKEHGFEIKELFGKGSAGKGSVAVKYRDPKNSANTWTGRGRMPRWLVAATKRGKGRKRISWFRRLPFCRSCCPPQFSAHSPHPLSPFGVSSHPRQGSAIQPLPQLPC
jgi:DNA-binding protein H-NS